MESSTTSYPGNNYKVFTNVLLVVGVLVLICYLAPYLNRSDESYAPDRERTDPQSDWNIIEAVKAIRERQQRNINRMSIRKK
jgi:hypothetical protein